MTEALPVDLTYGHPGEASYDERRHAWVFSRIPGFSRQFRIIHETAALHSHITSPIPSNRVSAYSRSQNIRNLTRSYPDLVPAAHLLPSCAQTSEIVERFNFGSEPLKSELIAFCELSLAGQEASEAQSVQIAAVAGGSSGENVRIVRLNNAQYGWQDHDSVQLHWKTLQNGKECLWEGRQGPVQQLCFAEKLQTEHACWLAVRYHTSTTIIQLSTAPEPTQRGSGPYMRLMAHNATSAFYGNAIVTFPIKFTGGASHVDVCFSPWSKRRLGILDQEGRWSIWTIHRHVHRGELREATVIATGSVHSDPGDNVDLNDSLNDGWGRIMWIENPKTVLLATRTCLSAFHIDFPSKRLSVPDLDLSVNGGLILDMKRSPSDLSHAFVLTSTRIFWLGVDEHEVQKASDTNLSIRSLLSWKHFRDPADIGLEISVLRNGETSVILLYSRITSVKTFHAFRMSSSPTKTALLTFDPCNLAADNVCNPNDENQRIATSSGHDASMTIVLDILPDQTKSHHGFKPPKLGNSADAVEHYQLTALKHDLSVSEILVASTPFRDASNINTVEIIRVSDAVEGTGVGAFFDSFVTLDEQIDTALTPALHTFSRNQLRRGKTGTKKVQEDSWTLNLAWLNKDIQKYMDVSKISFTAALKALETACEQIPKGERPIPQSLFDLVNSDFFVEDVDMVSDSLVDVIRKLETKASGNDEDITECGALIGSLFTPSLCESWGIEGSFILSREYEMVLDHWLKPLSPKTPGRARIAIERVARAVAGQLCLAAYQYPVSLSPPIEDTVGMQQNAEQPEIVLAVRHKTSATGLSSKGKQKLQPANPLPGKTLEGGRESDFTRPTSSHEGALPTPDPTPSLRSRSSSFSTSHTESLASQRLRALVSLEPQPYPDDVTAPILKHWSEGVDPWSYDWENTQQAIDSESRVELLGEPSQPQHESTAEQPHKRRRMESAGTFPQTQPNRVISSQPQTKSAREIHASSQGDVPMSQPEPGSHGSRKPFRPKKQIAGFKN